MQISFDWKFIKEDYLIYSIVSFFIFIILVIMFMFYSKTQTLKAEVKEKTKKYQKVAELYYQLKACQGKKFYFDKDLLLIGRYLGKELEEKIISIKPDSDQPSEAVRIKFKNLTLNDLIKIFNFVSKYDNLEIYYFMLKKDFVSPDLIDLDLNIKKIR